MKSESYYRQLLQLYLSDELTVTLAEELFDFIEAHPREADRLFEGLDKKKLLETTTLPEELSDRMRARLQKSIHQSGEQAAADEAPQAVPVYPIYPGRRLRWAAAALFLLAAGAAGYVFLPKKPAALRQASQRPARQDVSPGVNAAVLTLSGGKQIVLDSTVKGAFTRQGITTVVNAGGQLSYNTLPRASDKDKQAVEYNTLTTQKANQYRLVLADGTRVWLDAASSITYPTHFTGKARQIIITGQAYLEVARNPEIPFTVRVRGQLIMDIGTAFNIDAYDDESSVKTTLASGSISVKSGAQEIKLDEAGEQVESTGEKIKMVKGVDMGTVLAWKNGYFSFDGADIRTVMRQISRWYGVQVRYEGTPSPALFGGEIGRNLNLSQVLAGLSRTQGHFRLEGNTLTVLP
jgi:transmembrane sensor